MLPALAPELLGRLRFPLGGLRKPEVRAIAAEAAIPVACRAESQDLCFLAGEGKAGFLRAARRTRRARRRDRRPAVVAGSAATAATTTSRSGSDAGSASARREPLYVLATDAATNRVVVGSDAELENDRVPLRDAVLHRRAEAVDAIRLRYRSRPRCPAALQADGGGWTVALRRPERRAAPGQTAVLYAGGLIVGHAVIGATAVD